MDNKKYKAFSKRLVDIMKSSGYAASRSPSGICMKTLSELTGASEQICRRFIRGDALPDYEKIIKLTNHLNVSPGWLLFGEKEPTTITQPATFIEDDLLRYILNKSHHLYREETENADEYADFVIELVRDVREIITSKENSLKIIDLAISSISSYKEKRKKLAM